MSTTSRDKRSGAEWLAFAIAAALLSVVVGAVVWLWVTDDGTPARLTAERTGQVRVDGDHHYVLVKVSNGGDRTAESVQVLAELSQDDEVVEDGEQTIDFLAAGESTELQFVFSQDPDSGELKVRAASYTKP